MSYYFAATDDLQGIGALGLDPWAILAQGVTFLVLFLIIKRFALEKIVDMLDQRHDKIDSGVRLGMKMEKEFEKLQHTVEEKMQQARRDADKVIDEANQESSSIIKTAEEKATHKVEQMLADAEAKVASDMERAKREMRKELVTLVAEATEAVLDEKLDREKDMKLIERSISEVSR